MNPDDMLRAYMGPSARVGPEAERQCLICGNELRDFEKVLSRSQTCISCEALVRDRNQAEESSRADKARRAYFAGMDEGAPELHRELAASKNRALDLDQRLAASMQQIKAVQEELNAEAERKKWEDHLAGFGIAPVMNRAQLLWALGAGVAIGVIAASIYHKHHKRLK